MSKNILFVSLFIMVFSRLHAVEILPEARVAYFYPTDPEFRDIYSGAGLYSVETNVQAWKGLYPWISAGFLYTTGRSSAGNKTTLYAVPIGLGLKYFFKFDRIWPYLGAGAVVSYMHIDNDSSFVTRNQSEWGVGVIAKSGFLAYVTENLFFDFFLDYTYLRRSFSTSKSKPVLTRTANFSGLSIGGGIGYKF